jgi:hypothetical protein
MSRIKTVIQQTSKTTAVTCNAYDATIQTVSLTDAADTSFSFQVNNSYVQDISAILLSPQYPLTTGTTTRTVTLTGTSGTANITIAGVNYLATFTSNLTTSATNFVTSHAATLLALGYTVTSSGAVITVSALTTVFPTITDANVSGDLDGTIGTQTDTATTGLPAVSLVSYQRGSFIVRVSNIGTAAFNNAVSFTYKLTHN